MKRGLETSGQLKCSKICIMGVLEREEQQYIENLFEQITKENFTSMVQKIDFQEVQEPQKVPKKMDQG